MAKRAKPGDIFVVELPKDTRVYGQILLDLRAQCVRPRLLPRGSTLDFFADTSLQRVLLGPEPTAEPLLPPAFKWEGKWPMIDHVDLVLEEVDFPQGLLGQGITPGFIWGEVWLPIDVSEQELLDMDVAPMIRGSESIVQEALHALGRAAEIDPKYKKPAIFAASSLDLRMSPHKARVHALLGSRIGNSYFETALRYGYDVRRFYGKEHQERELVTCPYCQAPFDDAKGWCPTCERETRHDAPSQMTAQQLAEWERVRCRACRTPILDIAIVCPACKAEQRD